MLAGRYTLLDNTALNELIPLCRSHNVNLSLAGPYNSGILAAGLNDELTTESKFFYENVSPGVLKHAQSIKAVCDNYQVPLKAVALQFGTASEVVASTVPGARSAFEAKENAQMIDLKIPNELWYELKSKSLIPEDCQIP
jgi:D-threo-aldose 1-dehydrogenase